MPAEASNLNPMNPVPGAQIDLCLPNGLYTEQTGTWGYDFVPNTVELRSGVTIDDFILFMKSTVVAQKGHKLMVGFTADWDDAKTTEWKNLEAEWSEGGVKLAVSGLVAVLASYTML
jgi:hypothetical protein